MYFAPPVAEEVLAVEVVVVDVFRLVVVVDVFRVVVVEAVLLVPVMHLSTVSDIPTTHEISTYLAVPFVLRNTDRTTGTRCGTRVSYSPHQSISI